MLAVVLLAAALQTAPAAAPAPAPRAATPPPECAAGTRLDQAANACVPETVAAAPDAPAGDPTTPPPADGGLRNNPLYKGTMPRQNPLAERPGRRD